MLLGYASLYPADACELELPDAPTARRLLQAMRPDIVDRLSGLFQRFGGDPRALDAALLATARLGRRHGSLGTDFHAYHNENHVLEVGERRLLRLIAGMGEAAPDADDIAALVMFSACHDLRQRELVDGSGPIGGNEGASTAEAFRILDACGFDREADRAQYIALELMIAGSTFDARPAGPAAPVGVQPPDVIGGSLARGLALWLDGFRPLWRQDPAARRGERLARLAADLDTANVGEEFVVLCETALRLCREREMRAGHEASPAQSALASLDFLGRGQEHYFFVLHRFNSREGEHVFGAQKRANGPLVSSTTAALEARFAGRPPADAATVMSAFSELTGAG